MLREKIQTHLLSCTDAVIEYREANKEVKQTWESLLNVSKEVWESKDGKCIANFKDGTWLLFSTTGCSEDKTRHYAKGHPEAVKWNGHPVVMGIIRDAKVSSELRETIPLGIKVFDIWSKLDKVGIRSNQLRNKIHSDLESVFEITE